jgi:hypothetical protein
MEGLKEAFWDLAMCAGAVVTSVVLVAVPILFIELVNYAIEK